MRFVAIHNVNEQIEYLDSNDFNDNEARKRAALELVKRNCETMNGPTDSKSKKSSRDKAKADDDIFEVPATQVSPRNKRHSSDFSFGFGAPTAIENKNLHRLQKQERHSMSIVSSPSMMKPKPEEPERKQPKTADAIFDEMKKSEEAASQAVNKVTAENAVQRSDGNTSDDGKKQTKADQPVQVETPNAEYRDWMKIDPESLRSLKESSRSLRHILEELSKAK